MYKISITLDYGLFIPVTMVDILEVTTKDGINLTVEKWRIKNALTAKIINISVREIKK